MAVVTLATALLLQATPAFNGETAPHTATIFGAQPAQITAPPLPEGAVQIEPPLITVAMAVGLPDPASQSDEPPSPEDIIVTGETRITRADPLAEVNLVSYQAVQAIDQALVAPIAMGYKSAIPEPIRDGLGNALRNVNEPVNFVNFLLQLKIGKALETVGRFAINSTLGVAGLFDVAKKKPFNLPHRRNSFANTMGYYGVKPGPYFYLPLIGSTTLRDLAGNSLDLLLLPTAVGKPFDRPAYSIPANVVMQLNARIERDAEIQRLQQESPNPYVEARTLYLQMRQNEIDALKTKRKPKDDPPSMGEIAPKPVEGIEPPPVDSPPPSPAPAEAAEPRPADTPPFMPQPEVQTELQPTKASDLAPQSALPAPSLSEVEPSG